MSDEQKFCSICGMPLTDSSYPKDADTSVVDWCKYCGTKDAMHDYPRLLEGMSKFIERTQKVDEAEARRLAIEALDNSVAMKSGRLKK